MELWAEDSWNKGGQADADGDAFSAQSEPLAGCGRHEITALTASVMGASNKK